jgi:hypothetical protein
MTGVSASALVGSTIAPGITSPTGGYVSVVIGSYTGLTAGILSTGLAPSAVRPKTVPAQQ